MPEQTTPEQQLRPLVVVMGVTGCGKTTIGAGLSQRLRVPYADADDFHPQANIDKMSQGIPLDDEDREPWLEALNEWLRTHHELGGVLACSALKVAYRDILRTGNPHLAFVHLHGDREVVAERVAGRPGHFMPASLVESQYATLEDLLPNEHGIVLDFSRSVEDLVADAAAYLGDDADAEPSSREGN